MSPQAVVLICSNLVSKKKNVLLTDLEAGSSRSACGRFGFWQRHLPGSGWYLQAVPPTRRGQVELFLPL